MGLAHLPGDPHVRPNWVYWSGSTGPKPRTGRYDVFSREYALTLAFVSSRFQQGGKIFCRCLRGHYLSSSSPQHRDGGGHDQDGRVRERPEPPRLQQRADPGWNAAVGRAAAGPGSGQSSKARRSASKTAGGRVFQGRERERGRSGAALNESSDPPGATKIRSAAGNHQKAGRGEEEGGLAAVRHDPQSCGGPPQEGDHRAGDLPGTEPA